MAESQPEDGEEASETAAPAPLRQCARSPLASCLRDASRPSTPLPQPFIRLVAENGRTSCRFHLTQSGATLWKPASLKGAMLPIGCLAIPSPLTSSCAAVQHLGSLGHLGTKCSAHPRVVQTTLAVLTPLVPGSVHNRQQFTSFRFQLIYHGFCLAP